MEVWKGSAWRTIRTADAYVNGAWRALQYGEAYIDGAWRQIVSFVQPLSLAFSPTTCTGSSADGVAPAVTNTVTATPTGGLAPFTYAWSLVSDTSTNTPTIAAPTSAGTTFALVLGPDTSVTGTFRCTITDALGTTDTADITATFFIRGGGGTS